MRGKLQKTFRRICCSLLFSVILLTACGGVTGTSRRGDQGDTPVSGGAVSGSVVSGGAVSEEAVSDSAVSEELVKMESPSEHLYYANSTNFYVEAGKKIDDYEFKNEGIAQYTLSGQAKETCEIPGYKRLFAVTEEGVYYVAESEISSQGDKLMRIPIHKGDDGTDVMEWENEEVILTDKQKIYTVYASSGLVTERYIYYVSDSKVPGEEDGVAVKYDRLEKRELSRTNFRKEHPAVLGEDGDFDDGETTWSAMGFIQYGERVYVRVLEGTMRGREYFLTQHMDSEKWEKITDVRDDVDNIWDERGLYTAVVRADDNGEGLGYVLELMAFDAAGNQQMLISEKEIKKFLVENKIIGKDLEYYEICRGCSVYLWREKIYIQTYVECWSDDAPAGNQWVVISYDRSTGKISLEQELMDEMPSNHKEKLSKELKKKLEDELFEEPGLLLAIYKGKAIYSEYDMDGYHYFSYDMRTGKKKRLTRKDPELYYLVYVSYQASNSEEIRELQKS